MQQRLIVEGNDAIVLSAILKKKGLPPPKGYRNPEKFKKEFVKVAGGISEINTALNEQLDTPDVDRIGIIVDANNIGAINRFKTLIDFIQKKTGADFSEGHLNSKGFYYELPDGRTIGIWVMPDNQSEGYLENFIGLMIEEDDKTWQFAREKVNELSKQKFCNFTAAKKQKALLHTYLALQKTPGLPMGTAVTSGFLTIENDLVENLADWFKKTFILE